VIDFPKQIEVPARARAGNRVYFVREKAQHIGVDNKIIGLIRTAKLHPVKEPVLALDTAIDFIVTDLGLAVFTPVAFER
jgi:hypothetical protein